MDSWEAPKREGDDDTPPWERPNARCLRRKGLGVDGNGCDDGSRPLAPCTSRSSPSSWSPWLSVTSAGDNSYALVGCVALGVEVMLPITDSVLCGGVRDALTRTHAAAVAGLLASSATLLVKRGNPSSRSRSP